jgi:hypothetical protein
MDLPQEVLFCLFSKLDPLKDFGKTSANILFNDIHIVFRYLPLSIQIMASDEPRKSIVETDLRQ